MERQAGPNLLTKPSNRLTGRRVPQTSMANVTDRPEPPRIPQDISHMPVNAATDQNSKRSRESPVVSSTSELPNGLRSISSTGSLLTQNSDGTLTKKRKRLLPFRKNFVGSWKEVSSIPNPPHNESSDNNTPAVPNQNDPSISQLTDRVAGLPADLKPAAAKRLGIPHDEVASLSDPPAQSSPNTQRSSRNHSSTSSITSIPKSQKAAVVSSSRPLERPGLPDHTIQARHTHDFDVPEDTFYFSSSDSETEDQKSGYSWRSSHTSNTITSPDDGGEAKQDSRAISPNQRINQRSPEKPLHSYSNQSPRSSGHPQRFGMSSPPGSRPTSFSRPFSRYVSARTSSMPSFLDVTSRAAESHPLPQLTAIREDSPVQVLEPVEASSQVKRTKAEPTISLLDEVSSSAAAPKIPAPENRVPLMNRGPHLPSFPAPPDKMPVDTLSKKTSGHPREKTTNPSKEKAANPPREKVASFPREKAANPPKEMKPKPLREKATNHPGEKRAGSVAKHRSARPLSLAIKKESDATLSFEAAEVIILQIFEKLDSFQDLFACARVNQGFYQVFKRNELRLMKNTLRNMSPAQWELREASPKEIIPTYKGRASDYTPTTYVQFHKRDDFVIKSLRSLMASRCRQLLRPETVKALVGYDPVRSNRVDDALWRIWTFCTIFGPEAGREYDVDAQRNWLQGGHQADRPATSSSSGNNRMTQTSLVVSQESESFGRGNYGGLTVDELYDMLEAWSCIKDLLQGILGPGRYKQAREHGVYDNRLKREKDDRTEEVLLDEWVFYLRALGLSTVADLAYYTDSPSDDVFSVARDMEWTTWTRPERGRTRSKFLQASVQHLHDEMTGGKHVTFEEIQEKRKSRGLELAAELREEKVHGMRARDTLYQHDDQSVSLWLAWMVRAEGAQPGVETRETADPETQDRETQHQETQDQDKQNQETQHQDAENQEIQNQGQKPQKPKTGNATIQDVTIQDTEIQDTKIPDMKIQETQIQRPETPVADKNSPTTPDHRPSSALSLFPPQYTRPSNNGTPRVSPISTPRRSRNNSVTRPPASPLRPKVPETRPQDPLPKEDQERGEQKLPMFSPRLSMCLET